MTNNRGWNWRNWKFNGQLGVKLHKSETKDYTVKGAQIGGSIEKFEKTRTTLKISQNSFKPKQRRFWVKNKRTRRRVVSSLFIVFPDVCPKMTAQGATFKVHLMPHTSTKIDNSCTKMVTWTPSITVYRPFRPINITTAPMTGLK